MAHTLSVVEATFRTALGIVLKLGTVLLIAVIDLKALIDLNFGGEITVDTIGQMRISFIEV